MLDNIKVEDVMFLDIETVPESSSYELINPAMQILWDKKSRQFRSLEQTPQDVYERAGIYSEFGKIICISVGLIREKIHSASDLNLSMAKMKNLFSQSFRVCF